MELLERGRICVESGLEGDWRGRPRPGKSDKRQVTVMERECWEAACSQLGRALPWTTRRANLLVEDLKLPRRTGDIIVIGDVRLEVTGEVDPCSRMEEAAAGLRAALEPDWRGGVACRVLHGGDIALGATVVIEEGQR